MVYMWCRNRVAEFAKWKAVFDRDADAHRAAGLKLVKMGRDVEDGENVFFMFEIERIEKAQAFIDSPDSAKAGEESGVIDGEYHFVEDL